MDKQIMIKAPVSGWYAVDKAGATAYVHRHMHGLPAISTEDKAAYINENMLRGATVQELTSQHDKRRSATDGNAVNEDGHKPGDLFYTSWGYEQTNIDFYQVVRVTRCTMVIREIGNIYPDGYGWTGKTLPARDKFKGDTLTVRRDRCGYYQVKGHYMLHKTDETTPRRYSSYA